MAKRRKMNIDDKRKGYIYGIVIMIIAINIYYFCIRGLLNEPDPPYNWIALGVLGLAAVSFAVGQLIVKLRIGPPHDIPEEK